MVFKRVFMPMLVMGLILGLSGMAFAQQAACSVAVSGVGSTGSATATGHTEPVGAGSTGNPGSVGGGAIHIDCNNIGAVAFTSTVGVLTINLGVPITNNTGFPGADNAAGSLRIGNLTGAFAAGAANYVGIAGLTATTGTINIGLGNGSGGAAHGGAAAGAATLTNSPTAGVPYTASQAAGFDILGVLVSLNGTGKTAVTATLTVSPGAGFISGTPLSVNVIDAVVAGIKDPTIPAGALPATVAAASTPALTTGGAAVLTSNGGAVKSNFTLRIEENYAAMFKESAQFNGGGAGVFPQAGGSDTAVSLLFNNVPTGFNINGCVVSSTDVAGTGLLGNGAPTLTGSTVTNASPILTIFFNGPLDLTQVNVLWVSCNVDKGTATLPLSTNITVQATLAPTGAALSTGATPAALTGLTTGQVPRYNQLLQPTTPLTAVVFPSSSTTLLVPFATVGGGLNTGLAIANTTTDVFPAGLGAVAQDGTLTFTLYGQDGTVKSYTTTTGAPGAGLTTAGVLKSGGTYSVNVSEIAAKAGAAATWTGYVFVTANFTNAHGAATVYSASSAGLVAVLSTPVLFVPTPTVAVIRPNTENLGF